MMNDRSFMYHCNVHICIDFVSLVDVAQEQLVNRHGSSV